jgi:hypothetical protein
MSFYYNYGRDYPYYTHTMNRYGEYGSGYPSFLTSSDLSYNNNPNKMSFTTEDSFLDSLSDPDFYKKRRYGLFGSGDVPYG